MHEAFPTSSRAQILITRMIFQYIHRLPPDESPVDIEKIIDFAQTICIDMDHPQKMRAYALERLDWSVKMKKLRDFLEDLVSE